MAQPLEYRVELVERRQDLIDAGQEVYSARVHELESWRVRDEPRIAELVTAAQIAREVRAAITAAGRRRWNLWQRVGAGIAGTVVTVAALADVVSRIFGS